MHTYTSRNRQNAAPLRFFFIKPVMMFVLFLFCLLLNTGPAQAETPLEPIEDAVERILVILKSDNKTEWAQKREKISKIIKERFDFDEQSRLVLASKWDEISAEQKKQFIALFSDIQEYSYVNRLKDYSDEKVTFSKHLAKGDKAVVYSTIVRAADELPIIYRMTRKQGSWYVYDVIIDGVSLVKNYRQQFSSIIEKEEFPGLIAKMEEKIELIKKEDEGSK